MEKVKEEMTVSLRGLIKIRPFEYFGFNSLVYFFPSMGRLNKARQENKKFDQAVRKLIPCGKKVAVICHAWWKFSETKKGALPAPYVSKRSFGSIAFSFNASSPRKTLKKYKCKRLRKVAPQAPPSSKLLYFCLKLYT